MIGRGSRGGEGGGGGGGAQTRYAMDTSWCSKHPLPCGSVQLYD